MDETYAEITSHGCHSESQAYGEGQRELAVTGARIGLDTWGRCSEFLK